MAIRNARAVKRSSSSSSFSAVTTVIFIAFCVLGAYMLTSSSMVPARSTDGSSFVTSTSSRISKFISYDRPPSDESSDGGGGSGVQQGSGESRDDDGVSVKSLIREVVEEVPKEGGEQKNENTEEYMRKEEETEDRKVQEQIEDVSSDGGSGTRAENQQEQEEQRYPTNAEENDRNQREEKTYEDRTDLSKQETKIQNVGEQIKDETQMQDENGESKEENQIQEENGEGKLETQLQDEKEGKGEPELQNENRESTEESGNGTGEGKEESQLQNESEETQEESQVQNGSDKDKEQDQHPQKVEDEKLESVQLTEERNNGNEKKPESTEEESSGDKNPEIRFDDSGDAQESQLANQTEKQVDLNTESFSDTDQSETRMHDGSWDMQTNQSENEKERPDEQEVKSGSGHSDGKGGSGSDGYTWQLCNVTAGPDYIPCLDNEEIIMKLPSRRHFEHRERHCPEESPTCLVPLPQGYKHPVEWPKSRDKIWYHNVPHTKLADVKGHQNWVKKTGEYLTFPGGGTQFIHGADLYIDFIRQAVPKIAWGKQTRVILDVGCGVASFGGYLFNKDVLTMSFAPKDEHEAQVQFALERGIPAISAVMGSQRLPFPSGVFDIVHCARCRVPWHAEGGMLLLELNRALRPGGYFVWSATPVYQKLKEDAEIWTAMKSLTASMCWELVTIKKHKVNGVAAAIYRKPTTNDCYLSRKHNQPPMCAEDDDPNAAWYVPLQPCLHKAPIDSSERGSQWPEQWPRRLRVSPYWLNNSQTGIYGKPAPADFNADYEHWKRVVSKSYLSGLGISWSNVRNVMDMRAIYGGFAAALNDLKVWVMNVVNIDAPDTLPIIFERGLFGIYHDWCESFSTYPRTYDLLHADELFSRLKKRCNLVAVIAEVDRLVRPGGKLIVRDDSSTISDVESMLKSLHWEVRLTFFSSDKQGILSAEKTDWRPL
ncbi:probable methyltransferase PMT26 [Aristolochia californica]|uniref:probable methyltransferase PMT26 n=1 Tax=Aristolochia californica TaxID=171875 RepID=UPI0035D9F405